MSQTQEARKTPQPSNAPDERIVLKSGGELRVVRHLSDRELEVSLRHKSKKLCFLHWGLARGPDGPWQSPPESAWPTDTRAFGKRAVQTPFEQSNGESRIVIRMNRPPQAPMIAFALFFPEEGRWDNNQGRNYHIRLPGEEAPSLSPTEALKEETSGREVLFDSLYDLDGEGSLAVAVCRGSERYRLSLITSLGGTLLLHWGLAHKRRGEWVPPPAPIRPPGTVPFDDRAVQTPFVLGKEGLYRLQLELPADHLPIGVSFVLREVETGRWFKDRGKDFYLPVDDPLHRDLALEDPRLSSLADAIISAETSRNSWTLMHRFDLCYDLLNRAAGSLEGLALVFVWLRYSAIRQLDWQRNYNTKPRELSHSLDRLTQKLADTYGREPAGRDLVRLMFTNVGRGGEGQRIRDEILEIMHRHHVKEVTGHFLEEWHQKLHNNTTPDDIVICEAYLEFLKSGGDLAVFYKTLEAGGVTRERLESYERPIRSAPDFVPYLRDGLILDFEHFLGTLRAVHSGVDLETAVHATRGLLDPASDEVLSQILAHREDGHLTPAALAGKIVEVRRRIRERLDRGSEVRELLFLDLALESALRAKTEQRNDPNLSLDDRVDLVTRILENFVLSHEDPEIEVCMHDWQVLAREPRSGRDWALKAAAVADRLTRGLADFAARFQELLQPKAVLLGQAFEADSWAVEMFSEEVVRGTLASVLAAVLHPLQPQLRKAAHLGDWQVISPGHAAGSLQAVEALESVQGNRFPGPVVILTGRLTGYEEIPEGAAAILTTDGIDALSHLAIRARNGHVPFATCYNQETFNRLRSREGQGVRLVADGAGEVKIEQGEGEPEESGRFVRPAPPAVFLPRFTTYALPLEAFEEGRVGRKSLNVRRLAEGLPEWISVPRSVAIPFGVFERVREAGANLKIARNYDRLAEGVDADPDLTLEQLKRTVLSLEAPPGLMAALSAVMEGVGFPRLRNPEEAWKSIKRVWASTWNKRAYLSRKARGMAHGNLHMAVLIQEVVDAEYGFVIHTVNPLSGIRNELYAEAVLGLGETLVSNHPGSALRVVCAKDSFTARVLAYPSKSFGLYGEGLIFRSDSSGEDLAGYAGAGLYDSFLLEPPARVRLDYAEERLSRDKDFLREFTAGLTRVGVTVEELFGEPQDIEGAYRGGRFNVVQTRPQVGVEDG